jgi:ABC-2 type transport system permease protein
LILNVYFPDYAFTITENIDNAEQAIENGDYDLAISVEWSDDPSHVLAYTVYERAGNLITMSSSHIAHNMIRDTYQQRYLAAHNLGTEQIMEVLYPQFRSEVHVVGRDQTQTFWIGYVMILLMLLVIMIYGQMVSSSVVVEKSSKAMELLITSAKPFQLMLGKVFGVGLAALTQFGLIMLSALLFFNINSQAWSEFNPTLHGILSMSMSADIIIYAIVFFIFGFFSFAFILAGFACTASRAEELNSIVIIPQMFMAVVFYVAMLGSITPDAGYVQVLSFIPFFSPLVIFMRICVTGLPFIDIMFAIAVNIVTILLAALACSRIYRVGVMLYGKKPKLKDIIKYVVKG